MNYVPTVKIKTADGTEMSDIFSALLRQGNIIMVHGPVTDDLAATVNAQLLYLSAKDPQADICMYINSPGGSVSAGLSIYDTMNFIPNDVVTLATGMAASMASFLLSGGTKGKRYALPNAEIMIHQVRQTLGQDMTMTTDDILRNAEHSKKLEERMLKIYAENTGKDLEQIKNDTRFDNYMTPDEAKDYGLIDRVIVKQSEMAAN